MISENCKNPRNYMICQVCINMVGCYIRDPSVPMYLDSAYGRHRFSCPEKHIILYECPPEQMEAKKEISWVKKVQCEILRWIGCI